MMRLTPSPPSLLKPSQIPSYHQQNYNKNNVRIKIEHQSDDDEDDQHPDDDNESHHNLHNELPLNLVATQHMEH